MSDALPADLLRAYQAACHEEGESLEAFFERALGAWPDAALLALLDRVEGDIQENIGLMIEANPALEAVALARATEQRRRVAALRARVRGQGLLQ